MTDSQANALQSLAPDPARPGARENITALTLGIASIAVLAIVTPMARWPIVHTDVFIPAYESALTVIDLITAVLLFGYFRRSPSAAALALACAYLFTVPLIIAHALTFPGAFSPSGLLDAGPQSTPWLYVFWHAGFSLLVMTYALFAGRPSGARWTQARRVRLIGAGATLAVDAVLIFAAIAGRSVLPPIMFTHGYSTAAYLLVGPVLGLSSFVSLALLWRRRKVSALDLWLLIVMAAWLCDIYLSAIRGSSRFELGWYVGRIYGLLAASLLLITLVSDFNRAQAEVQRRAAELATNEARLRSIFETTHLYQGLLSREGAVLYSNTTSLQGLGLGVTLEAVLDKPFWETPWFAATPGAPEAVREAVARVAEGESVREELRLTLPGGVRWFDFVIRPITNERGQVLAMVPEAVDITERRQTEESLRQSQKIEAIGQLTGGVAHDFNNLLMVISGGLSMLDRQPDAERRQRIMDGMRQATERGAALNRQLLAFARRQPLKAESIDLAQQITSMRELLDRTLRGDVFVEVDLAADLWPIHVDPTAFELAILNLCVNARDAMPEGGVIVMRAANVPQVRQDDAVADFVRVEVVDTGVGMSAEVLERAFEPFFTTKEVGSGSGLGLAQVHGFAHQSGGSVSVASQPEHGTSVTLLLPRGEAGPVSPSAPAEVREPEQPPLSCGAVLLVEDDEEVAALVADMLSQLGYAVTRTASAQAALGALADDREIDIVFSDVMMPGGMNGVDLAREIRRRRPGLAVLLTSGFAEAIAATAATERLPLLPKPYDLASLDRAIRDALAEQASG